MKFKKIIAGALAFAFLSSINVFAADTTATKGFTDVKADTNVGKAIMAMHEAGYVKGYTDGTFKPDGNITRAELTRVFNQVFGYSATDAELAKVKNFTDNDEAEAWYYNDVRIAQSNGYINGFEDNSFRPKDNFTRQQTCVVLSLAAKLPTPTKEIAISDEVSEWAKPSVEKSISAGAFALETGNTFRATQNITRGEVCEALAKYIKKTEVVTNAQGEAVTNAQGETVTEKVTSNTTTTESTTETTTAASSSGGSSGGGGGGGSSTVVTTTATTVATTEATTEATTAKVTTTTTTEATTEATTAITLSDKEKRSLDNIITSIDTYVISNCTTSDTRDLAQFILDTLRKYQADNSYDFTNDLQDAKDRYRNLTAAEKSDLMVNVTSSCSIVDINRLKNVFEIFL